MSQVEKELQKHEYSPLFSLANTELCMYRVKLHEAKLVITTADLESERFPELTESLEMSEVASLSLLKPEGKLSTGP